MTSSIKKYSFKNLNSNDSHRYVKRIYKGLGGGVYNLVKQTDDRHILGQMGVGTGM